MRGVLCYADRGAGLNDRVNVLSTLLKWAWVLNARLNVPPPCRLLTPQHNFGARLDCNYTWDRYISVEPRDLMTTDPCSLKLTNFYAISSKIAHTEVPVRVERSPLVKREALKLCADMRLPTKYDFIHIRRTDAKHECDTSISRMRAALRDRSFTTSHVVYATDEMRPAYNNELVEILKKKNLTVYFPRTWLLPRFPGDNYMMFSIEQHLLARAAGKHQWRRKYSCS